MEFRKMRRFAQELGHDACLEMIRRATSGVLSVVGDDGYPYGVPMSFVYVDEPDLNAVNESGADAADKASTEAVDKPGTEAVDKPGTEALDKPSSDAADGEQNPVGCFYFHCAKAGHKLDAIRACDKACFTVIDRDDVVADEFTTYYKSVIAFGRVRIIEDEEEKRKAISILTDKYSPDESEEKKAGEINKEMPAFVMLELTVEHMTGKEAIELVRKRKKFE